MKDLDINNPDHRKAVQDVLRVGAGSEFWKIICQRLQMAIDGVQAALDSDDFINLIAEEYKIRTETLKKEKKNLVGIKDLPETMVKEMDKPEFFNREKEEEVYPEKEDFEK